MSSHANPPREPLIARTSPRALFAELVGGALAALELDPSPMATAYLIELLGDRLRVEDPDRDLAVAPESALLTALWEAHTCRGPARIERLRALGDGALFATGFFADSRRPRALVRGAWGDVGRVAYSALAAALAPGARDGSWPQLFEELADCFPEFVEVLAEVGARACPRAERDLALLYERYLACGSACARRRLWSLGSLVPPLPEPERWQ